MVYYSSHQSSIYWNNSSMHWNQIFNLLRCKIEWVLEVVSGFTNPFSSSFEDNEVSLSWHCRSFWGLYRVYCQLLIELPPKLLHDLQSHIEPTLDWPCSAAHNFDGNAILQSIIAFPGTFKDRMEPVFNQALKAGRVGFVPGTYMYIQCISSSLSSLTNIIAEDNLGVLFNTGVCN